MTRSLASLYKRSKPSNSKVFEPVYEIYFRKPNSVVDREISELHFISVDDKRENIAQTNFFS